MNCIELSTVKPYNENGEKEANMDNGLGNKEIMARNILRLMEQNGKDRMDVCKDLGISYTTFTDWVKGKTYPRIDKIEMLAKYFHVSKSDLVENTTVYYENDDTAAIAQEIFDNHDLRVLFDAARDADPEDLKTTYDMLMALKRKENG